MILVEKRVHACTLIAEANHAGVRLTVACRETGISTRTYQRWRAQPEGDRRPHAIRNPPRHALTPEERANIMAICHAPQYASLPPMQIVPMLADAGRDISLPNRRSILSCVTKTSCIIEGGQPPRARFARHRRIRLPVRTKSGPGM